MSNYSDSAFVMHPNTPWYMVYQLIPEGSKVLDVGCSSGHFGEVLQKEKGCTVDGIELDKSDADEAAKVLHKVTVLNIETDNISHIPNKHYDIIYFGDVIEHLVNPVATLERIKTKLRPDGCVVYSIPNMAHMSVRLMLLGGKFEYGETGLLDKTHLHFYDMDEVKRVFHDAGYEFADFDWVKRDIPRDMLAKQLKNIGLEPKERFIKASKKAEAAAYQFVGKAVIAPEVRKHHSRPTTSPSVNDFDKFLTELRSQYDKEIAELRKQVQQLERQLKHVNNSMSWRITKPMRRAGRLRNKLPQRKKGKNS